MELRYVQGAMAGLVVVALGVLVAPDGALQSAQHPTDLHDGRMRRRPPEDEKSNLCNCYFSGDCASGHTCYWGPGGPFTEDHCDWAAPKPGGVQGAGCDADTGLPGGCDGLCQSTSLGSIPGSEEPALVGLALDLWAMSFIEPAVTGGGPVSRDIGEIVFELPFQSKLTPEILGRAMGGLFVIAAGQEFFHPDPSLEIPPGHCAPGILMHVVADLSGEPWRVEALRRIVEALHCRMTGDPQGFDEALQHLYQTTPDVSTDFQPICAGADSVRCVGTRIRDLAASLTTPIVDVR